MLRGGDPDAVDTIVPMAFGNLAFDMLLKGLHGRSVVLTNDRYDNVLQDVVTGSRKVVNLKTSWDTTLSFSIHRYRISI